MISFTHIVYEFYFFHCISFQRGGEGGGGRVGRTQGGGSRNMMLISHGENVFP